MKKFILTCIGGGIILILGKRLIESEAYRKVLQEHINDLTRENKKLALNNFRVLEELKKLKNYDEK